MPEINPSRYVVNAGWSDVPHLERADQAVEDWQAVVDHLVMVAAPADSTNAAQQFKDMLEAANLRVIADQDTLST